MQIADNTLKSITFEAFADQHGLVLEIGENPEADVTIRYFCTFRDVETVQGFRIKNFGYGSTKKESWDDLARQLRGKVLVLGAGTWDRREIQCSSEWASDEATG
jgi:hypothetical protein